MKRCVIGEAEYLYAAVDGALYVLLLGAKRVLAAEGVVVVIRDHGNCLISFD